ncbi:hypothetical protein B0H16DRAFT_385365 [Mycena metata]|uniref:DUF6535 domain-containing protein n=1 Tax=Mycena metata TaxID=1033252 RepID=A0AAD7JJC6_9AGAR|nr:hypothetical protein B0H16DRAFT_385365 [Mycena metata]
MVRNLPRPTQTQDTSMNPENEAAAAKLWAIYVSEAEKYDKSLVESWKSDMEGMLIFAGLFSASLTAFLIESYKTLVPDSGDTTVLLLSQISGQLAASANGTAFNFVPPAHFAPPASALICNILWFISLGLSLSCALVATLLEQWARDFLHRAEMRSAPVIRARVFSYLYYGLKRFGMHTVVETIPLLLHASLLFFFAGLIAFLIPVNIVITAVAAAILTTVIVIYATLTLLPLSHPDCPYRTPLSGGFWRLRKSFQTFLHSHSSRVIPFRERIIEETMVDGVFREATEPSDERHLRDEKALVWTLKSLTHDTELEALLDVIPDVTSSGLYHKQIRRLTYHPDFNLTDRVGTFLDSSFRDTVSREVAKRRQIVSYKTIWALGSLSNPGYHVHTPILSHRRPLESDAEIVPYYNSALAIQMWAELQAAKPLLDKISRLLAMFIHDAAAHQPPDGPGILQIQSCLKELRSMYHLPLNSHGSSGFVEPLNGSGSSGSVRIPPIDVLSSVAEDLLAEVDNLPLQILLDYLRVAYESKVAPYQFDRTQVLLSPLHKPQFPGYALQLVQTHLARLVHHNHTDFMDTEDRIWLDDIFATLVSYWDPQESYSTLPWAVVEYLTIRKSEYAVRQAVHRLPPSIWKRIHETILPQNPIIYIVIPRTIHWLLL